MSAVSFLTAVSPSDSERSGETPSKEEKQEDDSRLKKGTVVIIQRMVLEGCVVCWQNKSRETRLAL